jgi:hypothetical protein
VGQYGLDNLSHSFDIELTYTSNAIEGNTLTAAETRMVVEHGITIGGKPLKDHLEAVGHFEALHYVRDLAQRAEPLQEAISATFIGSSCSARTQTQPVAMPIRAAMSKRIEDGIIFRRRPKCRH